MDAIGQRLKEERLRKGWSQRDLARETGVNADTISGIETGQHEPRPSTLRRLTEGLGIEVRDLFAEPALPKARAPRTGQLTDAQSPGEWLRERLLSGAIAVETVDETGARFDLSVEDVDKSGITSQLHDALKNIELGEGEKIVVTIEPVTDPATTRAARTAGRAAGRSVRIASAVRQRPLFGESGEAAYS